MSGIGTLGVRLKAGTKCPRVFRIARQGRWLKRLLWQLALSLFQLRRLARLGAEPCWKKAQEG